MSVKHLGEKNHILSCVWHRPGLITFLLCLLLCGAGDGAQDSEAQPLTPCQELLFPLAVPAPALPGSDAGLCP